MVMSRDEERQRPAGSMAAKALEFIARHKMDLLILLFIFLVAFFIRYSTLMDGGITWDERFYVHAGISYIDNLLHLNFGHEAWLDNNEQPPVSKYLYGFVIGLFNGGHYDYGAFFVSRVASALMGATICLLVYIFCREFFNTGIAIAASLILSLIPDFVAHTQIAALDSPVAFFFTITVILFMIALKRESRLYFLASGAAFGLLIGTKFNGVLALPVLIAIFFVYQRSNPAIGNKLREMFRDRRTRSGILGRVDSAVPIIPFAILVFLAGAIFYVSWPWIWNDPLNFARTLKHWTVVPEEYLLGSLQAHPLYYYPVYFLVTTPALLFIPLAAGVYSALRSKDPFKLAILIWFIVPFAYNLSTFIQDGMRYLLMIYPPMAILIADGVSVLASRAGAVIKTAHARTYAMAIIVVVLTIYLAATLLSFCPYYLDYYNELSGGSQAIYEDKLYEFGWWGEGIYDSVAYLEYNAEPGSTVLVAAQPNSIIWLYQKNLTYICPENFSVTVNDSVDYFIINPFIELYGDVSYNESQYELFYETGLHGAPLVKVFKNVGKPADSSSLAAG